MIMESILATVTLLVLGLAFTLGVFGLATLLRRP